MNGCMNIADMHCDTISELFRLRKNGADDGLLKSRLSIDIEKMQKGGWLLQNFACFINLEAEAEPYKYVNELIDLFDEETDKNSGLIKRVRCYRDIEDNMRAGHISALLTVEEGEACEGSAEKLKHLYERGVRMLTLTWNYENSIGFPNRVIRSQDGSHIRMELETERGLKPFGIETVELMEELGMIIDVSHLSDAGIWDVIRVSKKPFAASHSNARSIAPHPRNLTDEMIRAMAERGCVAGLNFYPGFLHSFREGEEVKGYIDDCVRQLMYMRNTGGAEFVGLGSDYDGFDSELEWKDAGSTESLKEAFIRAFKTAGLPTSDIDKVLYKNVLRLYRDLL